MKYQSNSWSIADLIRIIIVVFSPAPIPVVNIAQPVDARRYLGSRIYIANNN